MLKIKVGQYSNHTELTEVEENDLVFGNESEPTSRLLEGSIDSWASEEWVQDGTLKGKKCRIFYLFEEKEIINDEDEPLEAEFYPWDDDHISWIEVEDLD